jgi:hypothetical protein
MTFEYDDFGDVMWVSLSEPSSLCVYVESKTPGVVLRVEEASGKVRGFQVLVWSRRIARGPILIPEIDDSEFQMEWTRKSSALR